MHDFGASLAALGVVAIGAPEPLKRDSNPSHPFTFLFSRLFYLCCLFSFLFFGIFQDTESSTNPSATHGSPAGAK
ncbi:hypothetical protein M441DRAFT_305595, partial [Trichoderma asperellum CBS 433.97]